ncbi:unnamed protein product [Fraxinus pennsylvanica]|uniref:Uncharacterized protein n=1 Tax=Fraxinus pennsylvanica TaxID=56036 RepID=A0AAD2DRH0_9LAMI|nr:unnamed protein product [Fraxinus pennsylvanica]
MGKQSKSRKADYIGKGKVTPVQIAFIVDRYLSDNNYPHTRSAFRSEASNLISKSPVREAPKSLLSLGAILDEYIRLKEQKVMLDQGWCRLEQEKSRIQNLLRGMQDVMNAYNVNGDNVTLPPRLPPTVSSNTMPKQGEAGHISMYNTPAIMSKQDSTNFSIPITSHSNTKRKGSEDVKDAVVTAKKSRKPKDSNIVMQTVNSEKKHEVSAFQSYVHDNALGESSVQGSNVVKCLSTQPMPSPLANSSGPKTPPRALSPRTEKSISPLEICSTATSSDITQQITSSTTQTIRVSPAKQIAYYSIEKTRCISTSSPFKTDLKRLNRIEHIKGRLDFDDSNILTVSENSSPDGTSTSEFDREEGILDFDMTNLDNFDLDFNLSELLVEFDLHSDGPGFSCQLPMDSSPYSHLGSSNPSEAVNRSSLLSEDMDVLDTVTTMMSATKCIKIVSPVKNQRNP